MNFYSNYFPEIQHTYIQKSHNLPFITDSPIKLDGGCSYFVESKEPLFTKRSQVIIDKNHRAFIQYSKYNYAYFTRQKRVFQANGYIDYYSGKLGSFILKIDLIIRDTTYSTIRSGKLILKFPKLNQTISIHGRVDEFDRYREIFFPH